MSHQWHSCVSCHTQTNQQFLKTVTEQSTEMEELRSQHRYPVDPEWLNYYTLEPIRSTSYATCSCN